MKSDRSIVSGYVSMVNRIITIKNTFLLFLCVISHLRVKNIEGFLD